MNSLSRFVFTAASIGLACAFVSDSASAQVIVPPDPITIFAFNANGSGCSNGSAYATVTPDGSLLSITYNGMIAEDGPDTTPAQWRKNCLLTVGIHVPQGFTYAVLAADHRGFFDLGPNVVGTQTADYYVSGQLSSLTSKTEEVGAADGSYGTWTRHDSVDTVSLVWAPCGRDSIAHINESVSVNNFVARRTDPNAAGMMAQDATDVNVVAVYRLQWKKC